MKAIDISTINVKICWYAYAFPELILENNATVINTFMY